MTETLPPPPTKRLVLGLGVWILAWIAALAVVPFVTASSLSTSAKATLTGILVLGGPKLGLLAAIAIMGKPGYTWLKGLIFGYLKPPATVSYARYRTGMAMLITGVVLGILEPYIKPYLPTYDAYGRGYSIAFDLLIVVSFFVLGGDFWDKLRALFIRDAKVVFPPESA